jgi:transcriptional regulator with XRE-family HTH domain
MSETETADYITTANGVPPACLADVGDRIRAARENARLEQRALAATVGVSLRGVSRWEAGERDCGVAGLIRVAEACGVAASSLLPARHQETGADHGDGQWLQISFMGHVELTGYVTEITLGGQPAFHVDLPERLWGGNPMAWEEYAASALYSRRPVSEESVRKAWEAQLERAKRRAEQEAAWRTQDQVRALEAGDDDEGPAF